MTVHFASMNEQTGWRYHGRFKTINAALYGKDRPENLLLGRARSGDRTAVHGAYLAIFVWVDSGKTAHAFRLRPGHNAEVERLLIPTARLAPFNVDNGPSRAQITQWFEEALREQARHAEGAARETRSYRYGQKPTWELVYEAVRDHGAPVSAAQVGDRLAAALPSFNRGNLGPDLSVLSVNCNSRGHHSVNRLARRTDSGNPYDKLFRLQSGSDVRFVLYDPHVHGVWELADVGEKVLRPRQLSVADARELDAARDAAESAGLFDPDEDARQRIMATIVRRDGQPAFRRLLLATYGGRCAISGCAIEPLIEAAHIVPYRGTQTNVGCNGLPLRADLHKLFDLHLLAIDPVTRQVHVREDLHLTEYGVYHGVKLRTPIDPVHTPPFELLAYHQERCGWMHLPKDAGAPDER